MCDKLPDMMIRYEYANNSEEKEKRYYDRVMRFSRPTYESKNKETEQCSGHSRSLILMIASLLLLRILFVVVVFIVRTVIFGIDTGEQDTIEDSQYQEVPD